MCRFPDPFGSTTHDHFRWEDRELLPALLDLEGVAGGWTFSFSHMQRHPQLPFGEGANAEPGSLRIRLLYLTEEPVRAGREVVECTAAAASGGPAVEEIVFSAPLCTIVPWVDW